VRIRGLFVALIVAALAVFVWRSQLFTVARPGAHPLPLALLTPKARRAADVDVVLAAVPVGMERIHSGGAPVLVHFWAPWEHHSGPQAVALDSLRRGLPPGSLQFAVVCFDPYPSVARYLGRMRLRLPVLLDHRRELSAVLPCPSMPYTYVMDASGRILIEQAGEVDWLAPATRAALDSVITAPPSPPPAAPAAPHGT
jgi:hypothetical protein